MAEKVNKKSRNQMMTRKIEIKQKFQNDLAMRNTLKSWLILRRPPTLYQGLGPDTAFCKTCLFFSDVLLLYFD